MHISTYRCPNCGAEMIDHYGEESDPLGWIEEDGERFRCEGKLTGGFYAPFLDDDGVWRKIPYRTRSCGWFTLADLAEAEAGDGK